jgi:hypothetical protein
MDYRPYLVSLRNHSKGLKLNNKLFSYSGTKRRKPIAISGCRGYPGIPPQLNIDTRIALAYLFKLELWFQRSFQRLSYAVFSLAFFLFASRSAFALSKSSWLKGSHCISSPFLTFTVYKALHFQQRKGPLNSFFAMKKLLSELQDGHLIVTCIRLLLPILSFLLIVLFRNDFVNNSKG